MLKSQIFGKTHCLKNLRFSPKSKIFVSWLIDAQNNRLACQPSSRRPGQQGRPGSDRATAPAIRAAASEATPERDQGRRRAASSQSRRSQPSGDAEPLVPPPEEKAAAPVPEAPPRERIRGIAPTEVERFVSKASAEEGRPGDAEGQEGPGE